MTGKKAAALGLRGTGQVFMEQTKYAYIGMSDQQKGLPQPPLGLPTDPGKPFIDLARPSLLEIPSADLLETIEKRQSHRSYVHEPLTLDELTFILWCTRGVKRVHGSQAAFRTVPSAGARHAFETFLLVNDLESLATVGKTA